MSELQTAYRKFALRVTAPMAGVVAFLLCAQLAGIFGIAWYQNYVAQRAETRLAAGAIAQHLRQLERTAVDYTTWNEAFDRLVATDLVDRAWGDENIAQPLIETRGMDLGFVVAASREVSYSFIVPGIMPVEADELRGGMIAEMMEEQRKLPLRRPVSGLVMLNGTPTLIALAPFRRNGVTIMPGNDRHMLVIGRNLDQMELDQVARTFLLPNLKVVPKTDPRTPSVPLVTRDGVEIAKLVWTAAQPGDALLVIALPLWAVLALGFGGLSVLIVRQVKSAADLIGDSEHRARHDVLTGLPNRAHLMARLDARCETLATQGGFVVLYIDLDGFKAVNDRHGHEAGDTVLRQVADRLRTTMTEGAFAARIGGDEFAMILFDAPSPTEVQRFGRAPIAAIERPIPIMRDVEARISATIGTAFAPGDAADAAALLRKADAALYRGKREGKGRICLTAALVA